MEIRTPFEQDILSQPEGLRSLAGSLDALRRATHGLDLTSFERIVLTGMGASHYATYSAWLALVAAGYPAWWIDTAELVHDAPGLLQPDTLIVAASQSGRSAETIALLDILEGGPPRTELLAITNDPISPLAARAHRVAEIRAGSEHAVGTRTYLNTLAAASILVRLASEHDGETTIAEAKIDLVSAATDLAAWLEGYDNRLQEIALALARTTTPPVTIIARGASLASALEGALVIKEAAKHPIEAMGGGQFRHGPIETAGGGTSFIVLGSGSHVVRSERLALDLMRAGAKVFWLGTGPPLGAIPLPMPRARSALGERIAETVTLQLASVALARAAFFEPGRFRTAMKVTLTE